MMFQKILVGLFVLLIVNACEAPTPVAVKKDSHDEAMSKIAVTEAAVVLTPTEGNDVTGEVMLTMTDEGMQVTGEVTGLTPGEHGFHFHAYGDCTASDGKSAGGHFNPEGIEHGLPGGETYHVGDMLNIVADDDGVAVVDTVNLKATFSGPMSVLGRSLIIHAGPDDYESQPSGNAGPRVACGVVGTVAETEMAMMHDDSTMMHDDSMMMDDEVTTAVVILSPTEGNEVAGTVNFTMTDEGMQATGEVIGLTPGEHGFHFHQLGDCRASDGKSAAGHFNPEGVDHGLPGGETYHVGDMLNIVADDDGVAVVDTVNLKATFSGPKSVLGRSLIIHAGPDDYESQPSGNAGPRVACGIVGNTAAE